MKWKMGSTSGLSMESYCTLYMYARDHTAKKYNKKRLRTKMGFIVRRFWLEIEAVPYMLISCPVSVRTDFQVDLHFDAFVVVLYGWMVFLSGLIVEQTREALEVDIANKFIGGGRSSKSRFIGSLWILYLLQMREIHFVGFLSKLLETKIMQVLRFKHGHIYSVGVSVFLGGNKPSRTGDVHGDISVNFSSSSGTLVIPAPNPIPQAPYAPVNPNLKRVSSCGEKREKRGSGSGQPSAPNHGSPVSGMIGGNSSVAAPVAGYWGVPPFIRSYSHFDNTGRVCHKGVRCDDCGVHPITGPRFKSKVKDNYDLCSICFSELGSDAEYTRIGKPIFYRSPFCSRSSSTQPVSTTYLARPWEEATAPISSVPFHSRREHSTNHHLHILTGFFKTTNRESILDLSVSFKTQDDGQDEVRGSLKPLTSQLSLQRTLPFPCRKQYSVVILKPQASRLRRLKSLYCSTINKYSTNTKADFTQS
ncbi:hypothetical protein C5167_051049 [Papaver somniferum]|uniref:ZZ-type domain-containing protein n=1 Tax=Papaver somniferum TaxID=3469 RepID=A0A4Y7KQD6_PAPSO|nr:hypothetical protein C5167_051049 [Papaver somniferum]